MKAVELAGPKLPHTHAAIPTAQSFDPQSQKAPAATQASDKS